MKKRDSYKGIPEDERKAVAMILGLKRYHGQKVTPQDVYVEMVQDEMNRDAAREKEKREAGKTRAEEVRERSLKEIKESLRRMAESRDILRHIETDPDDDAAANDTMARLVRLDLDDAGKELEQALCNLGVIADDGVEGWFVDKLKSEMPQTAEEGRK